MTRAKLNEAIQKIIHGKASGYDEITLQMIKVMNAEGKGIYNR